MSKITLSDVGSISDNPTSAANTINSNTTIIQTAFDNTLSRDGTGPNTMGSSLDMNSSRIINLPAPIGSTEPLRLTDANTLNGGGTIQSIPVGGASGQVLTKNSSTNYDVSWLASGGGRTQLQANRTYYVRTGGNDSNVGFGTNDDAHALATFNQAMVLISALDFNGFNVTLMAGNVSTTYTNNPILINKAWIGGGTLTIDLNGGTVTSNSTKAFLSNIVIPGGGPSTGAGNIIIQNGTYVSSVFSAIQNAGVGTIIVAGGVTVQYAEYGFEATGTGAIINMGSTTCNIATSTPAAGLVAALYGASVYAVSTVFNITGNISSSAGTFYALDSGLIAATGCSFSGAGTVTGARFLADAGIIEAGGSLTQIPGSSAGSTINGGVYKSSTGTAAQPALNVSATAGYGLFTGTNQLGIAVGGVNQLDYGITNSGKWTFNASPVFIPGGSSLNPGLNVGTAGTGMFQTASTNFGFSLGGSSVLFDYGFSTAGTFTFGASIVGLNSIVSSFATGGIGYTTGAGGTVTQATSRTTGVTLNKVSGAITLFNAAPVVGTWVSFTVTNSAVAATDTVSVSVKSGTNTYTALVTSVAAGSFQISFTSIVGTASDSPIINFNVIKGVTS